MSQNSLKVIDGDLPIEYIRNIRNTTRKVTKMTERTLTVTDLLDGEWYTIADLIDDVQNWGIEKTARRISEERFRTKYQEEILEILKNLV